MLQIEVISLNPKPSWVVVKIMAPFWIPITRRHLTFRVPKKGTIFLTTAHKHLDHTFSVSGRGDLELRLPSLTPPSLQQNSLKCELGGPSAGFQGMQYQGTASC